MSMQEAAAETTTLSRQVDGTSAVAKAARTPQPRSSTRLAALMWRDAAGGAEASFRLQGSAISGSSTISWAREERPKGGMSSTPHSTSARIPKQFVTQNPHQHSSGSQGS